MSDECLCGTCLPEETVIDLSYEERVMSLARDLQVQFPSLSANDALRRANEIIQSAEQVEAMYLAVIEEE